MFNFANFQTLSKKTLDHIQAEVDSLRTGGASPQLLDSVKVEAYGSQMKVTELAAITVSDPTLLVVSPWDPSVVGAIEKAIQQAGINLNPVVDGKIIRISVPPLTEETRQQLVKTLRQRIEDGKVMLRNLRTETKKEIEEQKGSPGVSEDNIEADLEKLEADVRKLVAQVEQLASDKEAKLLKV